MKITFDIDISNAAFDESPTHEVYRILRSLTETQLEHLTEDAQCCAADPACPDAKYLLRDYNGNVVGTVTVDVERGES